MRYFSSDSFGTRKSIVQKVQWVETNDHKQLVYRWINFIGEGVYASGGDGVPISKCAFPDYHTELSKDKFEMFYSLAKQLTRR